MIDEAEIVIKRHGSPYNALIDVESKNSILLNLLQIGEKLNKLSSEQLREKLPVKETYSLRNKITHDYGGIDLPTVEYILNEELKLLKSQINEILIQL